MPKFINWEPIKQYFLDHTESLEQVSKRFKVSKRAIEGRAAREGWVARRQELNNVVPINKASDKAKPKTRSFSSKRCGPFDEIEIVDGAIANVSSVLSDAGTDSRGIGSAASALVRLLEYRRKIEPPTAAALAEQVIASGISPNEFVGELKQAWQLQQRA